jgi:hypothetical protein
MSATISLGRSARWFRQPFVKLDDADLDPIETIEIVANLRAMLSDRGASFRAIADMLERNGIERKDPPELEPDCPVNVTMLRLLLTRYRAAIGMAGEVRLSTIIGNLLCGSPLTEIDRASIRDIRGRARLARGVAP